MIPYQLNSFEDSDRSLTQPKIQDYCRFIVLYPVPIKLTYSRMRFNGIEAGLL